MAEGQSHISFDDALVRHIGQAGPWQRRVWLAASLMYVSNACFILLMVFAAKDPFKAGGWECNDATGAACEGVSDVCNLERDQWTWRRPDLSVAATFDLVCGRSILGTLTNSALFVGYLIGSGLFGSLADVYGRRMTLGASLALALVGTVTSAVSPSYGIYLASRLVTGIGAAGQAMVGYLAATEGVGPAWRGAAGIGNQMFFIVGEFLLVLAAYLLQPWRLICWFTVALGGASGALMLVIPESPRWLLAKGRVDDAMAIIRRIAEENGTRPPLQPIESGATACQPATVPEPAAAAVEGSKTPPGPVATELGPGSGGQAGATASTPQGPVTLRQVLSDRHICRRFVILVYAWCVLCMTYYGISLALNGLDWSMYITFVIAAAAEIPSNVLAAYLIERAGRHNALAAGMLLGGIGSLLCSLTPGGAPQAILAAVAKFGCSGAFSIASIFTSELFPTLVRSAVLGFGNEAARVGGIAAPFIVLAGTQSGSASLPFLVFGCTSVVAAFLIMTLPETLGAPLPDSMKDMDAIQSIFSTKAWRIGGWREVRSQLFSTRAFKHGGAKASMPPRLSTVEEGNGELQALSSSSWPTGSASGTDTRVVHVPDGAHEGTSLLAGKPPSHIGHP